MLGSPILPPGTPVLIGGDIAGIIEEVIWARGMTAPFYLVEFWQDGDLRSRRIHAADLEVREPL